jgi:VIT1/CCC1 family predicted Fe2+/Mn2+ transporter
MQFEKFCKDEYFDHHLYLFFAEREGNQTNRQILLKMAEHEWEHYLFWKEIVPSVQPSKRRILFYFYYLLRKILGLTFTIKLLELHEKSVITQYEKILNSSLLPDEKKEKLKKILEDEKTHEHSLSSLFEELPVRYAGFVALGLADAIVEITGVHAGFLGVSGSTRTAGVAGIIVGVSASISMGSAAYIQAKQDPHRNPTISAVITLLTYLFTVIFLALPYFLTNHMGTAFFVSALLGVGLIFSLTFYGAVVFSRSLLKEFLESTILMALTALITYFLGLFLGETFSLRP